MRDQLALRPFGSLSIRSFLLFVTTFVVTVFAFLLTNTQPVHAAGEATWKDGKISYEGNLYERRDDINAKDMNLPEGSKIYAFLDPSQAQANNPDRVIKVIYFEKDSDPQTSKKASYIVFKYNPADDKPYTNPSGKTEVTLAEQSKAEADAQTTSCAVEGIGWIVCPLTNFLSEAMDKLFKVMSEFLTVRPVQTDQESPLYRAWSMMRNIANVAFVMAFMVVIYSQLSNIGLSTHGIKRMLPRLIVAAILVNVSYWICAVAVDISNIFGYSLYDLFIGMKDNLVGAEGNGWEKVTWHDLGAFILAGGTAAAAAGIGIYAFTAGAGAGIFMLLPILLGVLISALVALLVMAARQAIITILIIVAPLAFVAYLLPNTEKYFKKWQDLFTTMLMIFPMFAIVLGGAQLAGDAIIQNAGSSINLVILGMAVKVAPVVITPFLLKFSGSLLGKIAGVVNNPGKGLLDRTRNFAQDRRDNLTARQLANTKNPNALARAAQKIDANKRKREGWKKANDARRDATWANSQAYSDIHGYDANSSNIKAVGENRANAHYAAQQLSNSAIQELDLQARASKLELDVSKAQVEANWEELKAGETRHLVSAASVSVAALAQAAREHTIDSSVEARRAQSAQNMQHNAMSSAMQNDLTLQHRAGGIDPNGAQRSLAEALKKQHSIRGEAVDTATSIIDHMNVTPDHLVQLSLGNAAGGVTNVTEEIREAAIKRIASGKNAKAMRHMLDEIDVSGLTENQRITLSDSLVNNGARPKYVSSSAAAKIAQGGDSSTGGQPLGKAGVDKLIIDAITNNKYSSAEVLVTQEDISLSRVAKVLKDNKSSFNQATLNKLNEQIHKALSDPLYSGRVGERDEALNDMKGTLGPLPPPAP